MQRRPFISRLRLATAATAAALAAGAVTAATGSGQSTGSPATGFTVIEHAVTDAENPGVGGKDVKGNILTFNNPVYDAANKHKVGHDEGFCTRIQVKLGIWECLWTTFISGGQITVQGPYYDTRNSVMSITGGTGKYAGARGQMLLKSRNGGKQYAFVFQLLS